MLGWYIFAAILLAAVDFPLNLPGKHGLACALIILADHRVVFDLSHLIKGASEKAKANDSAA